MSSATALLRHVLLLALLASVTLPPAFAQDLPFFDGFESGQFNPDFWTARANLAGGPGGLIEVVLSESIAQQGDFGVRIGRESDGPATTNALDLHLDLSGYDDVELSFWIQDIQDDNDVQDGLFFSDDGGKNFVEAYRFEPSGWTNAYGQLPPLDLDELAAAAGVSLTSEFVIRFQQHGTGDFGAGCCGNVADGFYIDNVSVRETNITFETLPFSDGFEFGEFGSAWQWGTPVATLTSGNVFARPGGLVEVVLSEAVSQGENSNFGVRMGRRNDGNETTNALDLHLDLSGYDDVELSFWIQDIQDDTNFQDGLFFSDDGGDTFVKAYDFAPSGWTNAYGQLPPLDLDELAATAGVSLTSEFVIRFQQHGTGDFGAGCCGNVADGFYIDNVSVRETNITFAVPPIFESFELGELGPAWQWGTPVGTLTGGDAFVRPGGLVDVVRSESVAQDGIFGVRMGRRNDGNETTNALDLHLDLSSVIPGAEPGPELSFWIQDIQDDTNFQDGLFFSDDGGDTFRKVYDFEPSIWPNSYRQEVIPIDSLAMAAGLSLTSEFVIRFQQHGTGDFGAGCCGNVADGFYIDNVSFNAVVDDEEGSASSPFVLKQNYPNPFDRATTIAFALDQASDVRLAVYDVLGRRVATLADGPRAAGQHEVPFASADLPSGVYVYRLDTGSRSEVRRMVLAR